jgi:hypothetical protein
LLSFLNFLVEEDVVYVYARPQKQSSNLGDFLFYFITIKNLIKLECNENKF